MTSIYQLKPRFQQLLQPVLNSFHKVGLTANNLTWMGIIWSALIGVCIYLSPAYPLLWAIVPFALLIRMALNALDGMMARSFQQTSSKGELLNEMGDMVSDIFIFLPLAGIEIMSPILIILFVCLALLNETAGILAKVISGKRRYDGPMGKSDRAFFFGLVALLQLFWGLPRIWLDTLFAVATLLLILSTYKRLKASLS